MPQHFKNIFIFCVWMLCMYVCVPCVVTWCQGPAEGSRSPGTGVAGGCYLPCGCWSQTWVLCMSSLTCWATLPSSPCPNIFNLCVRLDATEQMFIPPLVLGERPYRTSGGLRFGSSKKVLLGPWSLLPLAEILSAVSLLFGSMSGDIDSLEENDLGWWHGPVI